MPFAVRFRTSTTRAASVALCVVGLAAAAAVAAAPSPASAGPAGSVVKVTGTQGHWTLQVDGAAYVVKGVTYGPPQGAAASYVRDIRRMGANTIRTWGVDDGGTPTLLTAASQNGIKVIVGHWLDQNADYVNDNAYKARTKAEIVARVNRLKGNPGVLMWDVGNEVILTMHGGDVEARRVAYATFIDDVARAIHAADPNHPVTSTDAYTGAWAYYTRYAPSLDLLAVNSYGGIGYVYGDWVQGRYAKPYIVTESGPRGEWEVPNDVNGVPTEPTDVQKRNAYAASWDAVKAHPGVALGVTEFHYGVENDFGGVWLNTFTAGYHRLGYYALQKAYTGRVAANTPPVITRMTVAHQTGVRAGSRFGVTVTATDPNHDAIRYKVFLSSKHINGSTKLLSASFTTTDAGRFTVAAPTLRGVWKVYVYAFDGHRNLGIEARSVRVTG